MSTSSCRSKLRLAIAALAVTMGLSSAALAQQPERPAPVQLPAGRPSLPPDHPAAPIPGQARPRPMPGMQGQGVPPRRLPPGMDLPRQAKPQPRPEPAHQESGHGAAHCPGHGPNDPPHHINWWHGILMVNNERAKQGGFFNHLLFRYENHENPCDPDNEPPPFLASLLNFGLLAFVLYRFGKKPVSEALQKRKQSIMQEIENARRLEEEAQARLDDYESKFDKMEDTRKALMIEYAAQSEIERKHLLAEAEARRLRMKRAAEFRVEQELKAAKIAVLHEAVDGAVSMAEEILKKRMAQADSDRLAQDYMASIGPILSQGSLGMPGSSTAAGGRS